MVAALAQAAMVVQAQLQLWTQCNLQPGFEYPAPMKSIQWSTASDLPYGPMCGEHRMKTRPTCTWREERANGWG